MMDAKLDLLAVEAVKSGDPQRYSELVERHEQRVYAVAWSRLGDADLAQEAAQEAFVKGYQRLPFLHHGEKFSAWIAVIARNMAINLGRRHRNELKKRKRWALEQIERTSAVAAQEAVEEPVSSETLRETLAELPASHRESLVLFYLEGKSIAEAARAAGLSETAFKTRLFRARGVLRSHLEKRLDTSLARLRPRHAVAPLVMGLLTSGKVKAAGMLGSSSGAVTKLVVGASKLLPFKLLMLMPWFWGFVPAMGFHYWSGRRDLENYKQQEGFRAQTYKRRWIKSFFFVPLLVVMLMLGVGLIVSLGGKMGLFRVLGLFCLYSVFLTTQQLKVNSSRYVIYSLCGVGIYAAAYFAVGFLHLSTELLLLAVAGATIFLGLAQRDMPLRMDSCLFMRWIKGIMPEGIATSQLGKISPEKAWAFARFLGQRWLIMHGRQQKGGMRLYMPSVRPSVLINGFMPHFPGKFSTILIGFEGSIDVTLSRRDHGALMGLDFGLASDKELLESHVAQLLSGALQAFLQGDMGETERLLGQQPEQEIFHITPHQSMGARWRQHWMVGIGVLLMVLLAFSWWSGHYNYPTQGRRLKAVQVHEDDVRLALDRLSSSPSQDRETWRAFDHALYFGCLVFPPQDSFAPKAWANLQDYLLSKHHVQKAEIFNDPNEVLRAFFENHNQHYLNPVKKGLWTSTELTQMRVTPSMARRYLAELSPWVRGHLGQVQEIGVSGEEYTALNVEECAVQIRLLQYLDCLDLVAGETLINQLCEHQVLPGHSLEGRKPISDRKLLHGLFHCMPSIPIRDTYYALVVLSALDGLDRIDREACIQGILRFHHGKGLFGSFKKDDGLHFTGGTHYTLLAYESLRMLNALGRVKDLHKWVFRPMGALTMAPQKVTWPEIEAWVLTQRLQEFIKEQRQNPNLKPPSLLISTEI